MNRPLLAILVAAPLLVATAGARADDPAAAARDLFAAGLDAAKTGDLPTACARFAEAARLDPHVGYAANAGRCEAKRGHVASARRRWQEAVDLARRSHDARLAEAERELAALEGRVPRLAVSPPPDAPAGLTFRIDDVDYTAAAFASPIPVDPGVHVVEARAPGRASERIEVEAQDDGSTVDLELPVLARLPEPTSVPAPASPPWTSPVSDVRPTWHPRRTWAIVAGSAGLVAAGTGTYFALRAISKNEASRPECDTARICTETGAALRSEARAAGDAATVAFATAGALTATAVVLWIWPSAPAVAPSAGPRQASLTVRGTF